MHPTRTPIVAILALAALAACGAQSPQAGDVASAAPATHAAASLAANLSGTPKSEVIAAFGRLGAARSYRAVTEGNEASGQERLQIEYLAPDRLRVTTADGVQTIIGEDMYLQIDGGVSKQPVRAGVFDLLRGQWTHIARMLELPSTTVEAAGSERVDGREARKYRIFNAEAGGSLGTIWLSDGYPLRIETQREEDPDEIVNMRYSHINHPDIRIDPPG